MEAVKAERELEAARLRAWKEEADAAAARAAEEKKMLADKAAAAERAAGEAAVMIACTLLDLFAFTYLACSICVSLIILTPNAAITGVGRGGEKANGDSQGRARA